MAQNTKDFDLFTFRVYLRDLNASPLPPPPTPSLLLGTDAFDFASSSLSPVETGSNRSNRDNAPGGTRFLIPTFNVELVIDIRIPISHPQLKTAFVVFLMLFASSGVRDAFLDMFPTVLCFVYALLVVELVCQGPQGAVKLLQLADRLLSQAPAGSPPPSNNPQEFAS